MKKILLAASVLAVFALQSCSPSKDDMKKEFVKSCEEGGTAQFASLNMPADKVKTMVHDYCDCSGDKIVNKYSASEIKEFEKLSPADRDAKLMPVIQPCINDLQTKVMQEAANGMGGAAGNAAGQ